MKNTGFTLAEVLITLAIIGVAAAMTIPNLLSQYRKKIVETRLAKFYSVINQVIIMSEVDNGPKEFWDSQTYGWETDENDELVSGMIAWFNKYIEPYVQKLDAKTDVNQTSGKVLIYFSDGSLLLIGSASWIFYPEAKNYKLAERSSTSYDVDASDSGTKYFTFFFSPANTAENNKYHYQRGVEPYKWRWDGTREMLLETSDIGCKETVTNERAYCTALIQMNDWKIPDDYPLKF